MRMPTSRSKSKGGEGRGSALLLCCCVSWALAMPTGLGGGRSELVCRAVDEEAWDARALSETSVIVVPQEGRLYMAPEPVSRAATSRSTLFIACRLRQLVTIRLAHSPLAGLAHSSSFLLDRQGSRVMYSADRHCITMPAPCRGGDLQ